MQLKVSFIDKLVSKKFSNLNKSILKKLSKLSNYLLFVNSMLLALYFLFSSYNKLIIVVSILYLYFIWYFFVFIQKHIKRERPYSFFGKNFGSRTPYNHSFPSTHSLLSGFYFMLSVVLLESSVIKDIAIMLSILVPFFRLASLQHWISDVVVGFVLGVVVFYLWFFGVFTFF